MATTQQRITNKKQVYKAQPSPDQDPTDLREYTRIRIGFKTTAALKVTPEMTCEVLTNIEVDEAVIEAVTVMIGQVAGVTTLLGRRWEQQLQEGGHDAYPEPLIDENEDIAGFLISRLRPEDDAE